MGAFTTFSLETGLLFEQCDDRHPTRCAGWRNGSISLTDDGTHFGFVYAGRALLQTPLGSWRLLPGMFFAQPGAAAIEGPGSGLLVTRLGYRGFFQIGGPIESNGRLRYIDGCTDSLLIQPVTLGDPCLNLLHFPPGIDQTMHTHPSARVGLVARGRGVCKLRDGAKRLEAGAGFLIPAETRHAFATGEEAMDVIAYHPDSDFGPIHNNHPMINRTVVHGVSARDLPEIQTRRG